jgi:hypothetical protein
MKILFLTLLIAAIVLAAHADAPLRPARRRAADRLRRQQR